MTKHGFLFLALALSLVLAGCMHDGNDGEDNGSDATPVEMKAGNLFEPQAITVPVGTTVAWRNADSTIHNVRAQDGSWGMDENRMVQPGNSHEHTFTVPGTYEYRCVPHSWEEDGVWNGMTGTIIVTEEGDADDGDETGDA